MAKVMYCQSLGKSLMCNWLIKFKGGVGKAPIWISVFCETEDEAIKLSEVIEETTGLEYDYEITCTGTGQ